MCVEVSFIINKFLAFKERSSDGFGCISPVATPCDPIASLFVPGNR
jgi:hypothetical protein